MPSGLAIVITDDLKPNEEAQIEGHLFIVIDGKRYRVVPFGIKAEIDALKTRLTVAEGKLPKV